MADTEALLFEVADAVISCKKEKVIETVEKAKLKLSPEEIIEKGLSSGRQVNSINNAPVFWF